MGYPANIAVLGLLAACLAPGQTNSPTAAKERALGRSLAADMERKYSVLTDPVVNNYFSRIGDRLAEAAGLSVPITVKVVDTDERFAESLPGGYVYLTAGLIVQNADGSLLSRIMAHQVAHIATGRGIRIGSQAQLANLATVPLFFNGGPFGFCSRYGRDNQGPLPVAWQKQQKQDELEAEALVPALLQKSGLNLNSPGPPAVNRLGTWRAAADEKPPTLRRPGEAR